MQTIVAFDFDGTLTKKDSFLEFISFSKGKTKLYLNLPYMSIVWGLFKLKILKRQYAKEAIFSRFFKGMPIQDFNNAGEAFSDTIDSILRTNVKNKIASYISQDYKLVIVSASIDNWITPWALQNNIETIISTQIEVDTSGLITGQFKSLNCVGQEKVNRFLEVFPNRANYKLIVYGDTEGDKALMDLADESHFRYFE
jgi:HAD superfamily hydrolase (TIGR01490 family)